MVIMTMMEMTVVSNVRGEDLVVNCLNREKMICEKEILVEIQNKARRGNVR